MGQSDGEMYQAFDMEYDYDIWGFRDQYLEGKISLDMYSADPESAAYRFSG